MGMEPRICSHLWIFILCSVSLDTSTSLNQVGFWFKSGFDLVKISSNGCSWKYTFDSQMNQQVTHHHHHNIIIIISSSSSDSKQCLKTFLWLRGKYLNLYKRSKFSNSESYSDLCQIPKVEFFAKIISSFLQLNIFTKIVIDVWQVPV